LTRILERLTGRGLERESFPLSFASWSEYISFKKKELGIDDEEEEDEEEEEDGEEEKEEETTKVESEGSDESEDDEEDELETMFDNLSKAVLSQHNLLQVEVPNILQEGLEKSTLNLLLSDSLESLVTDAEDDHLYNLVLSAMKLLRPGKFISSTNHHLQRM